MSELQVDNALPAGTMIEEFRLERVLGAGGFGIVYLAKGRHLDDVVAIKEFLPTALAERVGGTTVIHVLPDREVAYKETLSKFVNEAKILNRLGDHRNIAHVSRLIEANGTAYMVMDYVEAEPLSTILEREGTLSQDEVHGVVFPLLDGLERVHAEKIWHRDIKPSNILIRADRSPVLIDFGAARWEKSGDQPSLLVQVSPGFGAPEQIRSDQPLGPWTDIYGLAATLYQVVTGRIPPPAEDRSAEPLPPATLAATGHAYSAVLLESIDRALELDPEKRVRNVRDWRAMLRRVDPDQLDDARGKTLVRLLETDTELRRPNVDPAQADAAAEPGGTRIHGDGGARIRRDNSSSRWKPVLIAVPVVLATLYARSITEETPDDDPSEHPMPVLTPEIVAHRISKCIASFTCMQIEPSVSETLEVALRGFTTDKQYEALRDKLSDMNVTDDAGVHIVPVAACEYLAGLRTVANTAPAIAPRIAFSSADRLYSSEGQSFRATITASRETDGYLYVDAVDPGGEVLHLLPNKRRRDNAARRGQAVEIGSNVSYRFQAPYGENVLVVIQSPFPLYEGVRPTGEPLPEYLEYILPRLRDAAAAGRVYGGFAAFKTLP